MGLVNIALGVLLLVCAVNVQPNRASRILYDERWMKQALSLQSLQRGEVPSSGSSGCTYIPGTGGPGCPLFKVKNYAGQGHHHGHANSGYPRLMVPFGVATNHK